MCARPDVVMPPIENSATFGTWLSSRWGRAVKKAVVAVTIAAHLTLAGCMAVGPCMQQIRNPSNESVAAQVFEEMGSPEVVTDEMECRLVGGRNRPGALLELNGPTTADGGTRITIHGINAGPDAMQPLADRGAFEGDRVMTFAYDDQYRRIADSSSDLARELSAFWVEHPGEAIHIDAHSLGARVALGAIDRLANANQLHGSVSLDLIAPPLAGIKAADGAARAPDVFRCAFSGVAPGVDMGPESDFQEYLEGIRLPDEVRVRVFIGESDDIASYDDPRFLRIVENLCAELYVADAGHSDVVNNVAELPEGGFSRFSLPGCD